MEGARGHQALPRGGVGLLDGYGSPVLVRHRASNAAFRSVIVGRSLERHRHEEAT